MKFKVRLHFNKRNGFVDRVEFKVLSEGGNKLSASERAKIFGALATRIHAVMRADRPLYDFKVDSIFSVNIHD